MGPCSRRGGSCWTSRRAPPTSLLVAAVQQVELVVDVAAMVVAWAAQAVRVAVVVAEIELEAMEAAEAGVAVR